MTSGLSVVTWPFSSTSVHLLQPASSTGNSEQVPHSSGSPSTLQQEIPVSWAAPSF